MNNFPISVKLNLIESHIDLNVHKGPNFFSTNKLDIQTRDHNIKPTNRQAYIFMYLFPPGASKRVSVGDMKIPPY